MCIRDRVGIGLPIAELALELGGRDGGVNQDRRRRWMWLSGSEGDGGLAAATLVGVEEQRRPVGNPDLLDAKVGVDRPAAVGEAKRPLLHFRMRDTGLLERLADQVRHLLVRILGDADPGPETTTVNVILWG